jgi:hypothetical protein
MGLNNEIVPWTEVVVVVYALARRRDTAAGPRAMDVFVDRGVVQGGGVGGIVAVEGGRSFVFSVFFGGFFGFTFFGGGGLNGGVLRFVLNFSLEGFGLRGVGSGSSHDVEICAGVGFRI